MPTLTWPYVHILINHFPVVLSVAALVAALGALITNRRGLWLNAMGLLTAAGLTVYPVHFTGDEADHALRDPWYIKGGVIDAHDNAAGLAMAILLIAGAIAAYGWWRALKRREEIIPTWMRAAVVVGALASFGSVAYAAYLGGKIIHDAPVLGLPEAPAGLPPGIATPPRTGERPSS
ncbi:MAG: hypothetical protein ABI889_02695 [Gemmatimonadota bacterium]